MRRLALAVAVVCATALAAGTGSFSAASLDRGVSIDIADDPSEGFVGIEDAPATVVVEYGAGTDLGANDEEGPPSEASDDRGGPPPNANAVGAGETVRLLTVRNNLDTTVTYRVAITDDESSPPDAHRVWLDDGSPEDPAVVGSGDAVDVRADVNCANQPSETWTVTITVDGGGLEGTVDHEVEVRCDGPSEAD